MKRNPHTYTHKDGVLYRDDKVVKGFYDPVSGRKLTLGKDVCVNYGGENGWWVSTSLNPSFKFRRIKVIV